MTKKKTKKSKPRTRIFDFSFKRILATMFAGFVGIGAVEFIIGSAFREDFAASSVFNAGAGLTGFIAYIIGASLIFGVVFYLLEQKTIPRTNMKEGLRLGLLYGVIVAGPWYVLNFFMSTHTQAYLLGSLIVLLLDYVVAGALAGFILGKLK